MKVLVVEDDSKIAAVVKQGLEAEGFSVEVSPTVTTACGGPPSITTIW